jgi:4,5-dihydroxyphthalate decarboxylase
MNNMSSTGNLHLTLACWDYDRTRAIMENRVRFDGIDLTYLNLVIEESFFRQMRHREFDVSEMSFSSYVVSMSRKEPPFIAIPVFPSRSFRHSGIYVNAGAGIREPKDLIGKRIGCAEYQLSANVWIRGILNDEYGVKPSSFVTFVGGLESPGRIEKAAVSLPSDITIQHIGPAQTLSSMLESGEIDAMSFAFGRRCTPPRLGGLGATTSFGDRLAQTGRAARVRARDCFSLVRIVSSDRTRPSCQADPWGLHGPHESSH